MKYLLILTVFLLILIPGCIAPGGEPSPVNTTYSPAQLKYILLDHYNESLFFYCDPDYYPISHGDEQEKAIEAFPGIQNDAEEFSAIVTRKGLQPPFSNKTKLVVYRENKKLNAIPLAPITKDSYSFSLLLGHEGEGMKVTGMIRSDGVILAQEYEKAFLTCPICLATGTRIDTPNGSLAVDEMSVGMLVWTCDARGVRTAVQVLEAVRNQVPALHRVMFLRLSDGREIYASPGHPTTDGRTLGMIGIGDELDGAIVIVADSVPFIGEYTYDILPSGDTQSYWANGILVKSSIQKNESGSP